jgi:ferredoxin
MSRSQHAFNLLIKVWPLGKALNRMGNWPVLGPLLRPCFSSAGNEAIILPVHEAVRGTESVVLPFPLLTPLVSRASARFILNECMCRRGENCQAYPQELGCLFLGDGAAAINPAMGRPASVDEALAHVQRAMDLGLVPLIVHASFDAWLLGIPYRRALAVCFCCDCCCTVRQGLRLGPAAFWETVVRLPGLAVAADADCTGCGACVEVCHVGAISLVDGMARIGEQCKGCGRCAATCPAGAITLRLAEDVDVLDRLIERIEQRTDIGPVRDSRIRPAADWPAEVEPSDGSSG